MHPSPRNGRRCSTNSDGPSDRVTDQGQTAARDDGPLPGPLLLVYPPPRISNVMLSFDVLILKEKKMLKMLCSRRI